MDKYSALAHRIEQTVRGTQFEVPFTDEELSDIVTALRAFAQSAERAKSEVYWLIERGSPAEWWAGSDHPGGWTNDVSKVHPLLKFDAEAKARGEADRIKYFPLVVGSELRVTEHMDCAGPDVRSSDKPEGMPISEMPCPFCGSTFAGKVEVKFGDKVKHTGYRLRCPVCDAQTGIGTTDEILKGYWERRSIPSSARPTLKDSEINDALDLAECCVHDKIQDPLEREWVHGILRKLRASARSATADTAIGRSEAETLIALRMYLTGAHSLDTPSSLEGRIDLALAKINERLPI